MDRGSVENDNGYQVLLPTVRMCEPGQNHRPVSYWQTDSTWASQKHCHYAFMTRAKTIETTFPPNELCLSQVCNENFHFNRCPPETNTLLFIKDYDKEAVFSFPVFPSSQHPALSSAVLIISFRHLWQPSLGLCFLSCYFRSVNENSTTQNFFRVKNVNPWFHPHSQTTAEFQKSNTCCPDRCETDHLHLGVWSAQRTANAESECLKHSGKNRLMHESNNTKWMADQ